ncbi:MAG TPA: hypothetical protein VMR34_00245 [Candidatus Saccharimonadales bacterium]|nr:hypothetical protein [Candidatus Saccharimonadales bacterium]
MFKKLPPLEAREKNSRIAIFFRDDDSFSSQEWISTLLGVYLAKNIGRQKYALTTAIVKVGASGHGLVRTNNQKLEYVSQTPGLEARFRWTELDNVDPKLAFIRTVGVMGRIASIGYRNPTGRGYNTSFAVADSEDYHKVSRGEGGGIGEVEFEVGLAAVTSLAKALHSKDPGFEIFTKLEAAGVLIVDRPTST